MRNLLRVPATEVQQTPCRRLYTFALDGKKLPLVAAVARINRSDAGALGGYQRPEVISHIGGIRHYIESADPLLPNAIVVAFDRRVRFEPFGRRKPGSYARSGEMVIPVDTDWTEAEKPGWIVDGQQRVAAIRDAHVDRFPICISAFITDSEAEQRRQFILVNSTKPLPKGLVYELLPVTDGTLPRTFRSKRFPAQMLERLNHDPGSPLRHLIHTPTSPEGVIKDNSILKMLEASLTDGALYYLRDQRTGTGDLEAMLAIVRDFWLAVRSVFPDAWGKHPRRSRLMHGIGIASMGYLMDAICDRFLPERFPTREDFATDLVKIEPVCSWTRGYWDIGQTQRRWNDLQNTPRDIQLLVDHLLGQYRTRVLGHRQFRVVAAQ
jgi:DGQHR domain-containing protein